MTERRELVETFQPDGGVLAEARVDRGAGRLADVALLGRVSRNDRVYTEGALADAADLYRDAHFFLDHPTDREMKERKGVRSVRDLAGKVTNPRVAGDTVRGDIALLDVEPTRSLVLGLAEQAPQLAGISHRASGTVRVGESGTQFVESLEEVQALELVTEPATVAGLHESVQKGRRRAVKRVLQEADLDPDRHQFFLNWAADRPDGVAQAERYAEGFERAVVGRPQGGGGGSSGPKALERDFDRELADATDGPQPVDDAALERAADRLWRP